MNTEQTYSRRSFLKHTALSGAALLGGRRVLGANDDIRVAIIGLGGKGKGHIRKFSGLPGVRVVAICDVDPQRLAQRAELAPQAARYTDARKVLDRKDIDAVVIATPDHWHALLAVWACQSGRDVYVEKPVSHNILEGRKIALAGKKYGRVIQSGTQYRSDPGLAQAAEYIRQGNIGKMKWGHVVWYELRGSIGKVPPHTPQNLDYDLYCGPAEVEPLRREKLHYDWHWIWSTGTGDLGNSGVHAYDLCRWLAGYQDLPPRAVCLGGRFGVHDAGETPNTQLTLLDYPAAPILIENRNLPKQKGIRALDHYRQVKEGVILQCEGGHFAGLRGGGSIYDAQGKRIKQFVGDGGGQHAANFIEAMRKRDNSILNAPIREGHVSSACCHLGNFSYQLGEPARAAKLKEVMASCPQAVTVVDKLREHLRANDVDPDKEPMICGPWLTVDPRKETIVKVDDSDSGPMVKRAKRLARGRYRKPFTMPKEV